MLLSCYEVSIFHTDITYKGVNIECWFTCMVQGPEHHWHDCSVQLVIAHLSDDD